MPQVKRPYAEAIARAPKSKRSEIIDDLGKDAQRGSNNSYKVNRNFPETAALKRQMAADAAKKNMSSLLKIKK
jgi:hypothetical protein